jgi:hypothetical protein
MKQQLVKTSKRFAVLCLASTLMLFGACKNRDIEELKVENQKLKAEMAQLRQAVQANNALSVAQSKPRLRAQSPKEKLELQAACASQAQEAFNSNFQNAQGHWDFTCHYNSRLNKCFMVVTSLSTNKDTVQYTSSLYDAYERKLVAERFNTGEGRVIYCTLLDKPCDSGLEFDQFVAKYMND